MGAEMWLWLVLMVALLVFEGMTFGLHAIWFAIGAMLAAICAAFGLHFGVQIAVFLFVSVVLLLLLRPAAKKLLATKHRTATNVERVFERVGIVTEDIDNISGRGAVYVDGKTWTARSYSGEPIPADTHVAVNLIDGVKLVVSPVPRDNIPNQKEEL